MQQQLFLASQLSMPGAGFGLFQRKRYLFFGIAVFFHGGYTFR